VNTKITYQVAIIGGGLGGLTLAIQLAKQSISVILFEKKTYPFHKVCGEYISLESKDYLERCGINFSKWDIPIITELLVSAPNGKTVQQQLPLGGFGISRYTLDYELKQLVEKANIKVLEDTTVNQVKYDKLTSTFLIESNTGNYTSQLCLGSFGKRSNLDVKFNRPFIQKKPNALNNFIGVKYHIRTSLGVANQIQLHNFKDGYCGFSKIENDTYCLCYLTTAANLQKQGSIAQLEKMVLHQNPHLKAIFESATHLYKEPLTISNIDFSKKELITNGVIFLGDAAGMITPLCGNGMSMAMHAAHHLSQTIPNYFNTNLSFNALTQNYQRFWQQQFAKRLWFGRNLQRAFGRTFITNLIINFFRYNKKLLLLLIRQTHGNSF
jgi:menaquinone-9 beta-reductase